jgi:hypothetical protein
VKEIVIARADLAALPEYSCSIPTGVVVGKRWRRDVSFAHARRGRPNGPPIEWVIGEYVADGENVAISWGWAVSAPGVIHRGGLK